MQYLYIMYCEKKSEIYCKRKYFSNNMHDLLKKLWDFFNKVSVQISDTLYFVECNSFSYNINRNIVM